MMGLEEGGRKRITARWYLVGLPSYKNLRERLKEVMDRKQSCLPEVEEQVSDAIPAKAQGIKDKRLHEIAEPQGEPEAEKHYRTIPPFPYQRPPGMSYEAFQKQIRRDKRVARYEEVRTLSEQGFSQRAIARKLKLSRKTVRKFVQAEAYPERYASNAGARRSLLDPYKGYLLHRWQHGCRNSVQLYDEIKARGFQGSAPLLRKFLAELRKKHQQAGCASALTFDTATQSIELPASLPAKPRIVCRMPATRASWLFVSQPSKLDEKQRRHVQAIRAGHPDLEMAYDLSQSFVLMLTERRGSELDGWLMQAKQSGIVELQRFATGLRRDYAAVRAAFSSRWSNGQVEAQVNRLKLQKRQMFGRANFDLLRLRVLHASYCSSPS
jgi:transposase